ncbi:MAG: hypothetical protein AB8H47_05515 [Bacteroidia bacterium]
MKSFKPNIRLRGSSLLYSLMISLLVSALLTAYLMADFSLRGLVMEQYAHGRANDNLRSAMTVAMSTLKYQEAQDFDWINKSDSMHASFANWGVFKLIHASGSYLNHRSGLSALLGQKVAKDREALVLSDEGYPLVLQGSTQIRGKVKVPKGLIQTDRYLGQGFSGSMPDHRLIETSQKLHTANFPSVPSEIQWLLDSLSRVTQDGLLILNEEIHHAWTEPTLRIKTAGVLKLREGNYKGKVIFLATEAIEVFAEAKLEDVILIAPKIKLHTGLRGRFQVFASDTLLLSDDVQLHFPSLLALSARPNHPAYLGVGTRCRIEGAVLYNQPIFSTTPSDLRPQVYIAQESKIYGTLHVAGNLELHGVVGGMVIAKGFVLRTAVGIVRNHLLNTRLIVDRLAPAYAGPFFLSKGEVEVLQIYPDEKEKITFARQ